MPNDLSSEPMAPETLIAQQVADALQGRDPSRFKRLRDVAHKHKEFVTNPIMTGTEDAYFVGVTNGLIMALSIIDETPAELMAVTTRGEPVR